MADNFKRHGNSVLAEWVLKLTLIFFVASIFFSKTTSDFVQTDVGSSSSFVVYLKFAVIIVFGIVISAISKAAFKIVGFSSIIIGSVLKIFMAISVDNFMLVDVMNLADSFLLIGVSVFYLYRHHRHEKKAKKVVKKKIRHA